MDKDLLIRFELVRLEDSLYHLCMTIHHLVMDGLTINIIFNELQAIYETLKSKKNITTELSAPKQYVDYEVRLNGYASRFNKSLAILDVAIWVVMRVLRRESYKWVS